LPHASRITRPKVNEIGGSHFRRDSFITTAKQATRVDVSKALNCFCLTRSLHFIVNNIGIALVGISTLPWPTDHQGLLIHSTHNKQKVTIAENMPSVLEKLHNYALYTDQSTSFSYPWSVSVVAALHMYSNVWYQPILTSNNKLPSDSRKCALNVGPTRAVTGMY
jgi:hypothetical protein